MIKITTPRLSQYTRIVGKKVIKRLLRSAENLKGKHVVHVNATSMGGGVAEILNTMVFLMNDLGIKTGWRVLFGSHSFFKITKGMHNALQGKEWDMSYDRQQTYLEYCERNSLLHHIGDHDIVIIHDPQPLGMIEDYSNKTRWVWRCHIDLSKPTKSTMNFMMPYIQKYDGVVISSKKFRIKGLKKPQIIIPPSIDPLSRKNKALPHKLAKKLLKERGIDIRKPIISMISRFDPWKNQFQVLEMFKEIKKHVDCQMVFLGDMASDDPEGPEIFHQVMEASKDMKDLHLLTEHNDLLVNALQRESAFVFQPSLKEGFALTVSEALWKRTPVIGTDVGGIPLQIIDGKTGYIMKSRRDGVKKAIKLLQDEELRKKMGNAGHEHVKKNFLITRHLQDYLDLFNSLYPPPNLKGI